MSESNVGRYTEAERCSSHFSSLLEAAYLLERASRDQIGFSGQPRANHDFSSEGVQRLDYSWIEGGFDLYTLYLNGVVLGAVTTSQEAASSKYPDCDLARYIIRRQEKRFELVLQYGVDPKSARFRSSEHWAIPSSMWTKPLKIIDKCLATEPKLGLVSADYGEELELFPDERRYHRRLYSSLCSRGYVLAANLAVQITLENRGV